MMIFNRLRNLFFVFFPFLFLFLQPVQGYTSHFPVQSWKKDGVLFRFSAERDKITEIWAFLADFNSCPDSAGPLENVDFTLFRHQGGAWKGKIVRVTGRLLRTTFVPDADLPSGGYYDTWFLFDDEKYLPARLLTAAVPDHFQADSPDAPEPVKEPGKILYRQERIEAAAVYYRQTAYSDGDGLYTAPTLVAENFRVLSKPADENAENADSGHSAADESKSNRILWSWQILSLLAALAVWLLIRRRISRNRPFIYSGPKKTPIPEFNINDFTQAAASINNNKEENNKEESVPLEDEQHTPNDPAAQNGTKMNCMIPLIFLFASGLTGPEGEGVPLPENINPDKAAETAAVISETVDSSSGFVTLDSSFWESITGQNIQFLTAEDAESVKMSQTCLMDRLNRNISEAILAANLPKNGESLPPWPESFGRAVRFSGKVNSLEKDQFGENRPVYRIAVTFDSGTAGTVFTSTIPEAWRENPASAVGAKTGGIGILFRPADETNGEVIFAKRTGLYDDASSAGRLGIDISIFDGIHPAAVNELETMFDPVERNNQLNLFRLTAQDAVPFYTLLADLGRLDPGRLTEEAAHRQAESGQPDASELFNHPENWQKQALTLTGHVKRARKIPIHDSRIRTLYGLNAYYELYLFTDDSQGYPLVCCTSRLPEDFPLGVGTDYRENVTLSAIFYKPWGYKAAGTKGNESEKKSGWIAVPLLIAGDVHWFPEDSKNVNDGKNMPVRTIVTAGFILLAGFWLYLRIRPKRPPIQFSLGAGGKKENSDQNELPPELPPGFPTDFSS